MKVFHLVADADTYRSLAPVDEGDYERLVRLFDGRTLGSEWSPIRVEILFEDHRPADYAALAGIPAFSSRATNELRDALERHGEVLPLSGADFSLYNVTELPDALDEDASEIKYMRSGRVMRIARYSLRAEALEGLTIFKLPQQPRSAVYITEEFLDRVQAAGLTGFERSELVWND
jgi:hypothetical protein